MQPLEPPYDGLTACLGWGGYYEWLLGAPWGPPEACRNLFLHSTVLVHPVDITRLTKVAAITHIYHRGYISELCSSLFVQGSCFCMERNSRVKLLNQMRHETGRQVQGWAYT